MLEVRDLWVHYGGLAALRGVDLSVPRGGVVGVLGPNGAGKSTLLAAVAGLVAPSSGSIRLRGEEVTGLAPHELARRGMCLVPERRGVFPSLTVAENLAVALGRDRRAIEQVLSAFPLLRERRDHLAGTLSGGEQQMLALARAGGARPDLLMADELSLGLAPRIVRTVAEAVARLNREEGRTVLLVEQHAGLVLEFADLVYVLGAGEVVWSGSPEELRRSPVLVETYLGARG